MYEIQPPHLSSKHPHFTPHLIIEPPHFRLSEYLVLDQYPIVLDQSDYPNYLLYYKSNTHQILASESNKFQGSESTFITAFNHVGYELNHIAVNICPNNTKNYM